MDDEINIGDMMGMMMGIIMLSVVASVLSIMPGGPTRGSLEVVNIELT